MTNPLDQTDFTIAFRRFLRDDPLLFLEEHPNLLGADDIAVATARLLTATPPDSVVGLWGSWGAGKTRVLKILKCRLTGSDELRLQERADIGDLERQALVCEFNPWSEQADTETWLQRLRTALVTSVARKFAVDAKKLRKACRAATKEFIRSQHWNTVRRVAKAGAQLAGLDIDELNPDEIDFAERDRVEWSATVQHLRGLMGNTPPRVFVFVDDLDRCPPPLVRSILDTAFTSLREAGVTFLIAADLDSVTASLAHLLPEESARAAGQYVEKLVPIDARMPSPTEAQLEEFIQIHIGEALEAERQLPAMAGVRRLLDSAKSKGSQVHLKGILTWLNNMTRTISLTTANPRQVKRLLGRYLRLSSIWNQEWGHRLALPEERTGVTLGFELSSGVSLEEADRAVQVLGTATCLVVARELRPMFFERFLYNNFIIPRVINAWWAREGRTRRTVVEEQDLWNELVSAGLNSDNVLRHLFAILQGNTLMEREVLEPAVHLAARA